VHRGTLTLGALVAFLQYSQRFFRPISDMSEKFNVLQSAMASSERIFKLLDEPVSIASPARPRAGRAGAGPHRVRDVWFAYNDDDYVLKDVSASRSARPARRHRRRHRVGQDDADQPAAAVLRRQRADHHRRRDVRELDLADVRGLFSLVLQDVHLFSGHDRRQHPARQPGDRRRARARAARAVHAEPFILRLPAATPAPSPSAARRCRSGQKQLLSFARRAGVRPRVLCSTRRPRASTPKPS
jgi:ABC-type multidrug transport system fused ATPase/permease subunit